MSKTNIFYKFNNTSVSNQDGTYPITFTGASIVNGPGNVPLGTFNKALDLNDAGKAELILTGLIPDRSRFCLHTCFNATGPINSRQNLVESDFFSIFLIQGSEPSKFLTYATVCNNANGWNGPNTLFKTELQTGQWYTITLAYDLDTAALFINNEIIGIYAFPNGALSIGTGNKLFFGTWIDGKRDHFKGALAGFKWEDGIPDDLQSVINDQRGLAEWFITRKYETVKTSINLNLGDPTQGILYDSVTGAHIQNFEKGALMYHDSMGCAFEMHGGIYAFYKGWVNNKSLGYLVSDEVPTTNPAGRKSLFTKGGIYWSEPIGTFPVVGQVYMDYEALGESRVLGFPTEAATNVRGGQRQIFQNCHMYYRTRGDHAYEVHGGILQKYLNLGGVSKCGFPTTNESDIIKNQRGIRMVIGKFSIFESCTIYWSTQTEAYEIRDDDIQREYDALKGPLGELGFPTSGEMDIPGYKHGGKMNTFQRGSILRYDNYNLIVARPFKIRLGTLDTKESEGVGMGQNDLFVKVRVEENSEAINGWDNKRMPKDGDWDGHNIHNINSIIPNVFVPNNCDKVISYTLKAWDSDPGGDDYLGEVSMTLDAANGWGLRENYGSFTLGPSSKIKSFETSVMPNVDLTLLSDNEKWWGVTNPRTPHISWDTYAKAFSDVDSDTEWYDPTDWLDQAFFEVVEDLANGGNCYGLCLEAIYAKKFSSNFNFPLNNYTNWNGISAGINVKHCYQVGSGAIVWFLDQFSTGQTHDPKDVFKNSRDAFRRGSDPILCINKEYDFGKGHALLPVEWDDSGDPWRITVYDPNMPGTKGPSDPSCTQVLTISPDKNRFYYLSEYDGGAWDGSRLFYIPFGILSHQPRTPVWDLLSLIFNGTMIIVGSDADTVSITDENGNDLSAFGARATSELQANHNLDGFFLGFKGFDKQSKPGPGNFLIRLGITSLAAFNVGTGPLNVGTAVLTRPSIDGLLRGSRLPAGSIAHNNDIARRLLGRTPKSVAADFTLTNMMPPEIAQGIENINAANASQNFIHKVNGNTSGKFNYTFKHLLNEIKIEAGVNAGDTHGVSIKDVGTSKQTMRLDSNKDKETKIVIDNKLGLKGDRIRLTIEQMPLPKSTGIELSIRPGLGDLEVITPGINTNIVINLEASINAQNIVRKFILPLSNGARIRIAPPLGENILHFDKIDRLFGSGLAHGTIKGIP